MDPSHYSSQRTSELSDPAMAPIKAWIESYVVWTELPPYTRTRILRRASRGEPEAIDALCNHNLRLVLSLAVKQLGRGVPLPDLIQEGWLGLREAAQKYEPQRGHQFSTMATHWIKQKLRRSIVTQGRTLYLPHKASEVLLRVSRLVQRGEAIAAEDQEWLDNLAREIYGNPELRNVSFDYFDHLLAGALSMDKPILTNARGGAEPVHTLADILPAPSDSDPSDSLDIEQLLVEMVNNKKLSRLEAWLLIRNFGLDGAGGRTYDEAALELYEAGVVKSPKQDKPLSRERIRQLITRAMTKIRLYVATKRGSSFDSMAGGSILREQTKRLSSASISGQTDSTESPTTRSTRNTSVDSSSENAASRAAAPLRLRAKSSTKRAKGSSRGTRKSSGLDVQYPEAI